MHSCFMHSFMNHPSYTPMHTQNLTCMTSASKAAEVFVFFSSITAVKTGTPCASFVPCTQCWMGERSLVAVSVIKGPLNPKHQLTADQGCCKLQCSVSTGSQVAQFQARSWLIFCVAALVRQNATIVSNAAQLTLAIASAACF